MRTLSISFVAFLSITTASIGQDLRRPDPLLEWAGKQYVDQYLSYISPVVPVAKRKFSSRGIRVGDIGAFNPRSEFFQVISRSDVIIEAYSKTEFILVYVEGISIPDGPRGISEGDDVDRLGLDDVYFVVNGTHTYETAGGSVSTIPSAIPLVDKSAIPDGLQEFGSKNGKIYTGDIGIFGSSCAVAKIDGSTAFHLCEHEERNRASYCLRGRHDGGFGRTKSWLLQPWRI